jgi:hypothetical protein
MEVWESQLKLWLAAYLDQGVKTTDSPTFAGLTLTAMSGVVKATAGVFSGGAGHSDLAGVSADQHHAQVHVLDGADHTVAGLTAGHVLQALTPTTFGFAGIFTDVIMDGGSSSNLDDVDIYRDFGHSS